MVSVWHKLVSEENRDKNQENARRQLPNIVIVMMNSGCEVVLKLG